MAISAILSTNSINRNQQNNKVKKPVTNTNISFKQREEKKDALEYARAFFNTNFAIEPNTNNKIITQKDDSGKIVKEVVVDANNLPIKITERNAGENVKITTFAKDGVTIKEQKEFDPNNEQILLKHVKYDENDFPIIDEYSSNGVLIRHEETSKLHDSDSKTIWFKNVKTSIYDENSGKILEHREECPVLEPKVTKYFYNESNKLIKTIFTERDYKETTEYNNEEKPIYLERHYFTKEENPKSYNTQGFDYYTKYVYNSQGQLLKELSYRKNDNTFVWGTKYNPETGKRILERHALYFNNVTYHYNENEEIDVERRIPLSNEIKTVYYDTKEKVPYREIVQKGNDYRVDRTYEPNAEKYKQDNKIESQDLLTRKYTKLDKYHFEKVMNRFKHEQVLEIEKDYTDPKYDIYKIKMPKNSVENDY